jgi:hypothetical protein
MASSSGVWSEALRYLLTAQRYMLAIGQTPPVPAVTVGKAVAAVEQKL